jgi:hypothetical protein
MTETKQTRRVAIRSFLVLPFAAGLAALPGCGTAETSYPVIPTNKSKEEFQKDVDNPFGVPIKEGKSKKRKK